MVNLTTTKRALIGFIGLGNMGAHMARNLIKKGHELVIFDLNKQVVDDLKYLGMHLLFSQYLENNL
jgi:3-hydroxyisobutyrate dehydrogenase-like beta-hydroxyacid dehydrogenase